MVLCWWPACWCIIMVHSVAEGFRHRNSAIECLSDGHSAHSVGPTPKPPSCEIAVRTFNQNSWTKAAWNCVKLGSSILIWWAKNWSIWENRKSSRDVARYSGRKRAGPLIDFPIKLLAFTPHLKLFISTSGELPKIAFLQVWSRFPFFLFRFIEKDPLRESLAEVRLMGLQAERF